MAEQDTLTPREELFVRHYLAGMTAAAAARAAGYSESHAARAADEILSRPRISAAVEAERQRLRATTRYDLIKATEDVEAAARFARENKNSMALVKATELLIRLHGLLVERVEVAAVDISGAIADARARAHRLTDYRTAGRIIDAVPAEEKPRAPVNLFQD